MIVTLVQLKISSRRDIAVLQKESPAFRSERMSRDGYDTVAVVGIPKTELAAGRNRNSVRIIGGKWRGRRVAFPDLPGLRPTPDRVRETLFNWLQHSLAGTRCLDLFAGSGALGLEALSRGAQEVVFVEQAQLAARNLKAQLQHLDAFAEAHIMEMGAARYLASAPRAFDIVFMDPPFGKDALPQYIALLDAGGWLSTGGLVYLENEKAAGLPRLPSHWEVLKSKSAGEVGYHLARITGRIKANE
jgi:16S rRNA (guanine966-N2)-methyltransferase